MCNGSRTLRGGGAVSSQPSLRGEGEVGSRHPSTAQEDGSLARATRETYLDRQTVSTFLPPGWAAGGELAEEGNEGTARGKAREKQLLLNRATRSDANEHGQRARTVRSCQPQQSSWS